MTLSQAILDGIPFEGVERLLHDGAPINIIDEYGFTPLIQATLMNNYDVVSLLLSQYNARVDIVDITGSTALHWAVDNDNLEIAKLLIQFGADTNSYTTNGQPVLFYPLLRQSKALIDLLLQHGANVAFAKDFIMAKLIGHRFELQGSTDVVNPQGLFIAVDLEGFYLEFTLGLVRDSLTHFINSYMAHRMDIHIPELRVIISAFQHASKLREFKHFNKDPSKNTQAIYQLLNVPLLLLPVSYEAHAITFIKYGNFLAKCDRGVQKMTDPIVINTVGNPQLLSRELLTNLLYQPHSAKYIKSDLVKILELTPYAKLPIKHQITGNCSWANVESSVPTMLYMLLHEQIKDETKVAPLVKEIMRFYYAWLDWDKDRAIEDCLDGFDNLSFQRQKSKAALLGAVLFQSCNPSKPRDIKRAQKILKILFRKEFHYIVRIYANVFVRSKKSAEGTAFQKLIQACGYKLSQFNN